MAAQYDLVIRGGMLADGTGSPLRPADVAVQDGIIVAVGTVAGAGREEIDAKGKIVTPGFVDIHTHYDGQVSWDSALAPSSWHGVTTAVMGNCGVGFAPVKPHDRERLVELMEGVEDIPGAALYEGLTWEWESFAEYLDTLDARPHDIDFCAQLPHGALRVYVMGERGAKLEAATDHDIAEMRRITADAMRAGAIGFSTSRSLNHRTVKGDPTPSLRATEAELTGIAMGISDAGRGVLEVISDFDTPDLDAEFDMLERIVTASGRPMSFSMAQPHTRESMWRVLLARMEKAANNGLPIKAQVAPRPIGILLGLQASLNPFTMHPSWAQVADKSLEEKVAALRDPAFRAQLLSETMAKGHVALAKRLSHFEMIFPLGTPPDYEPPRETSLAAQAAREGRRPEEIAIELMLQDEGRGFLYSPFANYAHFNLDAAREMMAHKDTLPGLGDGGAHVGIISDASFTTYALSHWGRDRAEGRFPIEWIVKRQTHDTARAVGLADRGVVAPGYKADLNVIDMDALQIERPRITFDLPAGGKRLLQGAKGYVATIVSGQVIYRDGVATGALPGRLVRGPQAAPLAQAAE
ncbi:N-acyl-D-amino-acid deacylase family protein [Zavarzinia sp. CC-PAN008]|uniref:N-acyl-D-amino-acid deacylase family protein n=1 Tax=Zavarzinia sp. CC-PAN008 TaxID=3243332 RepID=UPI003F747123